MSRKAPLDPAAPRAEVKSKMLEECGFVDVMIGPPADTFGGSSGEKNAGGFEVYG